MPKLCTILLLACIMLGSLSLCILAQESETAPDQPTTTSNEYKAPAPLSPESISLLDTFDTDPFENKRWIMSKDGKYVTQDVRWTTAQGTIIGIKGDKGLLIAREAQHYGFAAPVSDGHFQDKKELVFQYEVKFSEGSMTCGGSYVKLVERNDNVALDALNNETPYVIMFGPDYCGATNKVHFIFRHQNPVTKEFEEKHLNNPPQIKNDGNTHLYTLIVRSDQTYEVLIDLESVRKGSLLEDFTPPVNPPKEIDDPEDKKPADWVDEEFIPNETATKPDDWDESAPEEILDPEDKKPEDWLDNEPLKIPDPTTKPPADWSEEEDGKWEAPLVDNPKCAEHGCGEWKPRMIKNPAYKGKWTAPLIKNPAYKGVWAPKKIPNPKYFEDKTPYQSLKDISAVAIEIWTMQKNVLFDNVFFGFDAEVAKDFGKRTWYEKFEIEKTQNPKPETPETANKDKLDIQWLLQQAQEIFFTYQTPILVVLGSSFLLFIVLCYFVCCQADTDVDDGVSKKDKAEGKSTSTPSSASTTSAETSGETKVTKRKPKKDDQ